MINERELRIGNKVQKSNGEIFDVLKLGVFFLRYGEPCPLLIPNYNIYGIPLTDEILINSGFEMVKNEYPIPSGSISFVLDDFDLDKGDKGYVFGVEDEIGNNSMCFEILYVHQLQNFYSAVRNEELNIKI